jgi:hypothetical protein
MDATEFMDDKPLTCFDCGYVAVGHFNKNKKWLPSYKVLAGHILSNKDGHSRSSKRWAYKTLTGIEDASGWRLEQWGGGKW